MTVENPNRIEQIEILVRCAKTEEDPSESLRAAVRLMAQALVDDEELDSDRINRLAIELAKEASAEDTSTKRTFAVHNFLSAVCDLIQHQQIALPDGRVALRGGWNHENVPPLHDA